MIAGVQGKENAAKGYSDGAATLSAHTGDPGTTGANEIVGGVPAYARKPIVWQVGTVDGIRTSDIIQVDIPAGTDVAYIALWDANGVFIDKAPAVASFASQGVAEFVLTYTQD